MCELRFVKENVGGKHEVPLKGPCNVYIMLPGSQGKHSFHHSMPSDKTVV